MKKRASILTVALALAAMVFSALPAAAAELHPDHQGTVCPGSVCGWHFVNNQTEGAAAGDLYVQVNGNWLGPIAPYKTLSKVQHFYVQGGGTLDDARTVVDGAGLNGLQLPGKLVLSSYWCICGCGCVGG